MANKKVDDILERVDEYVKEIEMVWGTISFIIKDGKTFEIKIEKRTRR